MPVQQCITCKASPAAMKRPKNGDALCRQCFFRAVEDDCHRTIIDSGMFSPGETIACGASGGKDSTVLMHLCTMLNRKYNYGVRLVLVSVDEGIAGYRDESLVTVRRNSQQYNLPLTIVSYDDMFNGWSMDKIVAKIGNKSNCTYCGTFRRHALEKGARLAGATKIATGHNADDTAETVLMNLLRSDMPRLERCANPQTNEVADDDTPLDDTAAATAGSGSGISTLPRVKPMRDLYEKEIVLYAHYQQLDYFSTECTYSKEAFRGNARTLLKSLEAISPRCIANIVNSGEQIFINEKKLLAKRRLEVGSEEATASSAAGQAAENGDDDSQSVKKAVEPPKTLKELQEQNSGIAVKKKDFDAMSVRSSATTAASSIMAQVAQKCKRCGSLTSRPLCRACVLVDTLNGTTGPRIAVGGTQ